MNVTASHGNANMTADDAISHGISFFMLHRQISLLRNLPVTPAKLNSLLYTITTDFSTIKKGTLLRQSALLVLWLNGFEQFLCVAVT